MISVLTEPIIIDARMAERYVICGELAHGVE